MRMSLGNLTRNPLRGRGNARVGADIIRPRGTGQRVYVIGMFIIPKIFP